jgi:hypothetical protein
MGTQQSLFILLSVILIFFAISVGISIYNNITRNTFIKFCIQELTYFKARAVDYYKTSQYMGGSSYGIYQWNAENLAAYIGLGYDEANGLETEYATYTVTIVDFDVTFLAIPKEKGINKKIQLEYNVLSNVANLSFPE